MQIRPERISNVIKVKTFEIPSNSDYNGDTFLQFMDMQLIVVESEISQKRDQKFTPCAINI